MRRAASCLAASLLIELSRGCRPSGISRCYAVPGGSSPLRSSRARTSAHLSDEGVPPFRHRAETLHQTRLLLRPHRTCGCRVRLTILSEPSVHHPQPQGGLQVLI